MTAARPRAAADLRLDAVSKRFGAVVAVETVSLDVRPGEFLSLLGPSGSGKTTLLMMVAGFERVDSGSIVSLGRPIEALPPYRRNFGMVFQNYALFPHMSVAGNIAFPLQMRRVARAEREALVARALDLVRLQGYGERLPSQLSGGQQQRVALARALVFNPAVLLMDEPLAALDKKLREEMQLELRRIHEEMAVTTVFVTHDQQEALTLSDRVAVLNAGRLEQVSPPDILYERPQTRFVADFVGESNVIEAAVADAGGACVAIAPDGLKIPLAPGQGEPGARVAIVLRPEKLSFAVGPVAVLEGRVEQVIYGGDTSRFQVRVSPARLVTLKLQNRADGLAPKPGEPCGVTWSPDDMIVLAA